MFTRTFFEQTLPQLVGEYVQHRSLETVVVEVWTAEGQHVITGLRAIGNDGAVFFTEDDKMHFVPFGRIVKVEVGAPGAGAVGFKPPLPVDAK